MSQLSDWGHLFPNSSGQMLSHCHHTGLIFPFHHLSSSSVRNPISPHHLPGNSPCSRCDFLSPGLLETTSCFHFLPLFPYSLFFLQLSEWHSPCLRGTQWFPSHLDLNHEIRSLYKGHHILPEWPLVTGFLHLSPSAFDIPLCSSMDIPMHASALGL